MARLANVSAPYSRIKEQILRILKKNGYVRAYEIVDLGDNKKNLAIELNNVRETKYVPSFRRISKPGQRVYVKSSEIKKSRNGNGIFIVSTPKGVITGYEAHTLMVGGELLCEVY